MITQDSTHSIFLIPILKSTVTDELSRLPKRDQEWLVANQFKADSGSYCLLPTEAGAIQSVCVGLDHNEDITAFGVLSKLLPKGVYAIQEGFFSASQLEAIGLHWCLGQYQFSRYRTVPKKEALLYLPSDVNHQRIRDTVAAISLSRDLINTPAEDLRPTDYANIIKEIAKHYHAVCHTIEGDALKKAFPAVHAVGRAGEQPPCLIDMTWGNPEHPKLTLVGKGVCFDSGGLDIKDAGGMRFMKKDMGGSAIVLALAQLIMAQQLPLRLRLIVPLVENAIAGNAIRPGDILKMRSGKTVEIGNTDAEGRLILADALTLASEEKPDYIIDVATLTGAARIAVGPDICAYCSNNEALSEALSRAANKSGEMLCRLPLYVPYRSFLESKIADLNNTASTPLGGAITAALFLQEFVDKSLAWAHFDVNAWNTRALPGRPEGGEAMGLLTLYQWIERMADKN